MAKPEANHGYPHNIDICFIGPRNVGKTTLLATMHHELSRHLPSGYRLEPVERDMFLMLDKKWSHLNKLSDAAPLVTLRVVDEGSKDIYRYVFGLSKVDAKNRETKVATLTFIDTPGGLTSECSGQLGQHIRESRIVICTVDAGVLMEAQEQLGNEYNGYGVVHHLLKEHAFGESASGERRAVVFALIKAETWIDEPAASRMRERFQRHYAKSLSFFQASGGDRVAVYLPVQTLGCVRFSKVLDHDDGSQSLQYKRLPGERLAPRGVEQPLLYVVRFALGELHRRKNIFRRTYDWLSGNTKELEAALAVLSSRSSHVPDRDVYGNKTLFDV